MDTSLLTRLRRRNYRLTAQRRVVAEILEGENLHLTAHEILDRAQVALPEISRATVYNTLSELVAMGEVLELALDGKPMRYDPNVAPHHHHVFCEGCGAVYDVLVGVAPPMLTEADTRGIEITRADIVYRGTCRDCRAA